MKKIDLFPLWSTLLCYAVVYGVSWLGFGVAIELRAVPIDLLLQLVLAWLLYGVSRHRWAFAAVQLIFMLLLYVGSAIKLSIMGGPLLPDDVHSFSALVLIAEGWYRILLLAPMVVVVALIIFNFRWHKLTAVVLLALSGLLVLAPSQATVEWMDAQWDNVEWNQRQNYLTRGATLYTLQESYRYLTDRAAVDDPVAVARAMEALQGSFSDVGSPTSFKPRNVHLILLETFWDPTVLTAAQLSEDPFDPELRALWRETGYSRALSPVFGGYTANAEFEVLCGFPVDENSVKFERRLRNKVPCLPQVLAQEGYKTVASHPNIPAFWNRTNAYKRVGFETFWSIEDFKMDDMMNDEFLSDASFLTQLTEKLASNVPSTTPVFNYVVTIFGHLPFPLNEARPDVIKSASSVPEVGKYANTVYYKSREFMAYLKALRARDPESIIVAFGDHLPFLGYDNAGYVESGLLPPERQAFSYASYLSYVGTPLLVIDGQRGPVNMGQIPLYTLPNKILNLLGYTKPTVMDYARSPEEIMIRAIPGLHLTRVAQAAAQELCTAASTSTLCNYSSAWLESVELISNDLFMGRQYALAPLVQPPHEPPTRSRVAVNDYSKLR